MRLALLSDIHGNIQALDACLAHARAQRAQRFAFLGDLVGYGADPAAVVDRVMLMTEEGAIVLKGNHDAMAIHPPAEIKTIGDSTATWTSRQLNKAQRDWLEQLPLTTQVDNILLVHASADGPELWRYVYDERAATASLDAATANPEIRYVFGGHVHEQTLYYRGATSGLMKFIPQPGVAVPVPRHRQWLSTVGSVGQPRDGKPASMYALLDTDRAQLTFHRVPYNHGHAAAAIRRAGLPEFFAERLEKGR
ncbi:MAG TPA: metallophosphoesterase family protein [Rhodoferax sp.]|jgi:diadenosine tetraphosphatase ApaH/serine/threonine PP2A family protein phosphatase|nr:metallophosphoesterase family protein [Rhodoferax sp.]HPW84690.1 metallophosphoesterase family protein [Rhodoferax sp.]HQC84771.1 metallophosphoesterase family protein [Rhodoferax sp.]HQY75466.1 metallophosphoesterase family protein [Rhodoferax sp.]